MNKIKVIVCGAAGSMGRYVVKTVLSREDMELVGALDTCGKGKDAGELATGHDAGILISDDLKKVLAKQNPDVMVDFTKGWAAPENILRCLATNCACVVGTTGISDDNLEKIRAKSEETGVPVLIAPNFSLGAVLMMKFSREAARYFQWAEIIELHHENKADAPSGTALRTAELMSRERPQFNSPRNETEKVRCARGGIHHGVRIHSIRLQGLLAHQEVNLGGLGEVLKIRHDSISRECFMPGVMLGIEKVRSLKGLVIGLEDIL